jgi:4-hydroxyphenylacetate 3-monooxygenase
MLATGGVFANEVFVTCIPLREGEESYAISFAVPMNQGPEDSHLGGGFASAA